METEPVTPKSMQDIASEIAALVCTTPSKELAMIRQLQCSVCPERRYIQAHHLTGGMARHERGVGMRASDRWAVSLCMAHHSDLHRFGSRKEAEWFAHYGILPYDLAQGLWNRRGDQSALARVLLAHQLQAIASLSRRRRK